MMMNPRESGDLDIGTFFIEIRVVVEKKNSFVAISLISKAFSNGSF